MRKKLKVILSVLSLVAIMVSLVGCGNSGKQASSSSSSAAKSDSGKTKMKICIISSTGVDDGSFNQNCYEGIQAFLKNHKDCKVTDIKETDYNQLIPTVEKVVGDYDVFVLPGFNFAAIGDIAKANPAKKFIVVDSHHRRQGQGHDTGQRLHYDLPGAGGRLLRRRGCGFDHQDQ